MKRGAIYHDRHYFENSKMKRPTHRMWDYDGDGRFPERFTSADRKFLRKWYQKKLKRQAFKDAEEELWQGE